MNVIEDQLQELRKRFGTVEVQPLPGGATLVTVPNAQLPPGWSKRCSAIRFLVPNGYPFANLDCFWIDHDVRLSNGAIPKSAGLNTIPEAGVQALWFSWHLAQPWNPNRDSLSSWMNTIYDRLRRAE